MEGWLKCSDWLLGLFLLLSLSFGTACFFLGSLLAFKVYFNFLDGLGIETICTIYIVAGLTSLLFSSSILVKEGSRRCLERLCVATARSFCTLVLFITFSCLLAVMMVAGGMIALKTAHISQIMYVNMERSLPLYTPLNYGVIHTWNSVQRTQKCCGVNSYKDWFDWMDHTTVPDSCCIVQIVGCGWGLRDLPSHIVNQTIYQSGCFERIGPNTEFLVRSSGIWGLAMGILLLFCLLIALTLIRPIQKCFKRRHYQEIGDAA